MLATAVSLAPFPAARPAGMPAVTAADVDQYRIVFEGKRCGRCSGSGRLPQYGHIRRGVCFDCGGNGGLYTPRGRNARRQFDDLCAKVLPVPRDEVTIGDRVWNTYRAVGAWCPVTDVRVDDLTDFHHEMCANTGRPFDPNESYINLALHLHHPAGDMATVERTGQGYTVPRWDANAVATIVNTVAAMPGARIHRITDDPEDA